jgi:hypothetical protein
VHRKPVAVLTFRLPASRAFAIADCVERVEHLGRELEASASIAATVSGVASSLEACHLRASKLIQHELYFRIARESCSSRRI